MKDFLISALLTLLALVAVLVDCRESTCSAVCHDTCDTGEDIYNRWMDMTSEEIAESAEECNKICDPVCECMNSCLYKCFAQLRDCRYMAGISILSHYSCHSQFQECGRPCDGQCASAINLAGTKIQSVRNRIVTALVNFFYNLWKELKQPSPTKPHVPVKPKNTDDNSAEKAAEADEEMASRKRLSTEDGDSSEQLSEETTDSKEKSSRKTVESDEKSPEMDADIEEKSVEEDTESDMPSSKETTLSEHSSEKETTVSDERQEI